MSWIAGSSEAKRPLLPLLLRVELSAWVRTVADGEASKLAMETQASATGITLDIGHHTKTAADIPLIVTIGMVCLLHLMAPLLQRYADRLGHEMSGQTPDYRHDHPNHSTFMTI